jgi:hypothetical protein
MLNIEFVNAKMSRCNNFSLELFKKMIYSFAGGFTMSSWISVNDAAKKKNCTTANIRYLIRAKKLEAKKEKGQWLVNEESINEKKDFSQPYDVFSVFEGQLKEKDKQIALMQEQLSQLNQLLAMEKKEKLQLMEARSPWYRRLFKKS